MPVRLSGLTSGLDTDAIVQALVSAYSTKKDKYVKEQTKVDWKRDAWKSLNSKIYSLYTSVSNLKYSSAYTLKKTTVSDTTKATVSASTDAINGTQSLEVKKLSQTAYLTGAKVDSSVKGSTKLSELGVTGDTNLTVTTGKGADAKETTISLNADSTVQEFVNQIKGAGLSANFDESNNRIFISALQGGKDSDFSITAADDSGTSLLNNLGISNGNKIEGQNALIKLNGVEFEGSSNTFSINGLSITAQAITAEDSPITITTNTDSQGLYDKIKDFLTEYNSVINEMTSLYNAPSAGSYEPLTDKEKDAMSDTEVEKWEKKIKDSLLRNDSSLNSITSIMKNSMQKSYTIDGKSYSLSSFGIHTLGIMGAAENEQNAFHIDGDEDDDKTAGNTDKLMKAITDDPDTVIDFMKQLTSNLYTNIDKKMKSTTMNSAYKVYNDKQLDKEYNNYSKLISEWEDRLAEKEDYYYKKFSNMEQALAKLQSSSSSFTNMFGSR